MKRVLIDMSRLGKNPFNGLYTYSYQLGKSLVKLDPYDFELSYYMPEKFFNIFGRDSKYEDQKSIDKFFRFGTGKFDLWHSTTTLSRYRPFNKKTKFIFTFHDLNFTIEDAANNSRNKRLLGEIQRLVNRADHIIAISEFAKKQANELLNLSGKPTTIIYPGCSLVTEPIEAINPGYAPSKPFLFAIGLIEPRKNFHTLIPLLQGNDYELIIAGIDDHPYKNKIIEAAEKYDVEDRVKLIGPISEGNKSWYYQHCEAFMFPSFAEGFGSPVVEAMYYGKPVFTSRFTSLPEIGGDAAYYFDSFDPEVMQQNFRDGMNDFYRNSPDEKIRRRARMFSYDNTAKQCVELYRKILT